MTDKTNGQRIAPWTWLSRRIYPGQNKYPKELFSGHDRCPRNCSPDKKKMTKVLFPRQIRYLEHYSQDKENAQGIVP